MIEDYLIDASLGYPKPGHPDEYQVGLFVVADDDMAKRFRRILWRNGLHSLPIDHLPPKKPKFTHFTFVSAPDSGLKKKGIYERLEPLCEKHCIKPSGRSEDSPEYEAWQTALEKYIQDYRNQRYAARDEEDAGEAFEKSKAYELIHSKQYEEAEHYLSAFATDAPPFLIPAYLVYLYHVWRRPDKVIETHRCYASDISAGDVDHRVIEWIVGAYLSISPPKPEQALAVLDDFLPEFQRQRVAEPLLALRAQARAMQGQLPQTLPGLRNHVTRLSEEELNNRLEDLLEVASGLSVSSSEVQDLLDTIASRLDASRRWRIELERGTLARRDHRPADALNYLRAAIEVSPPDLGSADLNAMRLTAADLHLSLENSQAAVDVLQAVTPDELSPDDRRAYWSLQGRSLVRFNDDKALEALRRAYEAGTRRPDVLRPLARLAYREADSRLAWRVYTDLLHTGFEPSLEDRLYAGILAYYEENDPIQAVDYLRPALEMLPLDALPAETLLMAHETMVGCLRDIQAPPEELTDVAASWIDLLVAEKDLDALVELVDRISEMELDRPRTFGLLEAIEPVLCDYPEGRERLVEEYAKLFWDEVDISLRQFNPLPEYVLDLRRALFALDREQFEFAQDYLEEELKTARDADLVEPDFELEPSQRPALDLRDRWIAIVGGYAPMRRRVQEVLRSEYDLGRFTEVPPSWEAHVDQGRLREAVHSADLIIVVHRCMKHSGSDALQAVVEGTELQQRVRYAAGKGQSSVLRAVREYFESR